MDVDHPRRIAIVRREHYDHLRRLIGDLPEDYVSWVEHRFTERQRQEVITGLIVGITRIDPADYARDCMREGVRPSQGGLDDWASCPR